MPKHEYKCIIMNFALSVKLLDCRAICAIVKYMYICIHSGMAFVARVGERRKR